MSRSDVFNCFCGETYNYNKMKKEHYRKCDKFSRQFASMDVNIAKAIKKYVDNLDHSNQNKYVDGLLLLKFFMKRYVDLINEFLKQNDNYRKRKNLPDYIINGNSGQLNLGNSFNNDNQEFMTVVEKSSIKKKFISEKSLNIEDNEKKIIENYFDKLNISECPKSEDLKLISQNISNLITNDCIVFATEDSKDIQFTTSDDDEKYYIFYIDNIHFYIIFY